MGADDRRAGRLRAVKRASRPEPPAREQPGAAASGVRPRHRSGHAPHLEQGHPARADGRRFGFWILTAAALLSLAAGFWWTEGSVYGRAMEALHLFFQGIPGQAEPDTPWQIMVARTVAPCVSLFVTLRIVYGLYAGRLAEARTRRSRGHTVVCGLGTKGRASAAAFAAGGARVVGVDLEPPADAGGRRVRLVHGDATQALTLHDAGVARATGLVCACGPDDVNVAVAMRAAALRAARGGGPLTALVHVADSDLAEHVRASALALAPLRVQVFNVYEVLARRLLDAGPLAGALDTAPHVVIAGDGELARALAVDAARSWHFRARESGLTSELRVTLVGAGASCLAATVLARHPALARRCRLEAVDCASEGDVARELARIAGQDPPADVIYLAGADDSGDVRAAVALERQPLAGSTPVVVARSAFNDGFLDLLPATWTGSGRLVVVAGEADAYGRDLLTSGTHEAIAHAIHDVYVRDRLAAAEGAGSPALVERWDDLSPEGKEANRAQADAVVSQLQAAWYRVTALDDWDAEPVAFAPEEVELMAELEHERWMTEHRDEGWTYGPELDDLLRRHPDFVPWADLPENRRAIDRGFVRERPRILAQAGYRIIRDPARERAARLLHERYAEQAAPAPRAVPWDELGEEERALTYAHVDDVPYKLHAIGRRLAPGSAAAGALVLTPAETERLAELEHARWAAELERRGWRHGAVRDEAQRLHPGLVPWSDLPEDAREVDRVLVRAIPDLLERTGLVAVPIDTGGDYAPFRSPA